ncbi:MAG: hypothetical protein IJ731_06160 [Eubacterium sp.]|nr:hypothetical protein [Eubacterium sp.]
MARIRKDVTDAGKYKQIKFYPVYENSGKRIPDAPKKTQKTKEQMDKENAKRSLQQAILIINENFDENDFIISMENKPEFAPKDYEGLNAEWSAFIKRVKRKMIKKGLNSSLLKYFVFPHCEYYKSGAKKGMPHFHIHGYFSAPGMTSDEIMELWKYGTKGRVEKFKPYMYSPEAFAIYASNKSVGKQKYWKSNNCVKTITKEEPNVTINRDKLRDLAENRCDDKRYWEQQVPGYEFIEMDALYNNYNGHYYVTVVMYKKSDKKSFYEQSKKNAKPNLTYAYIH